MGRPLLIGVWGPKGAPNVLMSLAGVSGFRPVRALQAC